MPPCSRARPRAGDVETAAGDDEPAAGLVGAVRRHRGDDVVDVALDVDAGLLLEFLLALLVHGIAVFRRWRSSESMMPRTSA